MTLTPIGWPDKLKKLQIRLDKVAMALDDFKVKSADEMLKIAILLARMRT